MPTLTIKNVSPKIMERLEERAKRNGHSPEQEAREILGKRLGSRDETVDRIEKISKAISEQLGTPPTAEEIQRGIREGREGRQWSSTQ